MGADLDERPAPAHRAGALAGGPRLARTDHGDGNKAKTAAAPLVAILAADHDFRDGFPKTFPYVPAARDVFAADDALRARQLT